MRPDRLRSVRILVVEDQRVAAEAIQLLLEADGHEVVVAATFESAVKHLNAVKDVANPYHVALLDLKLPDGDGRQLVSLVKAACPKSRVYLATGSVVLQNDSNGLRFENTAELAAQLGADGCIGKPINYDKLCTLIQN